MTKSRDIADSINRINSSAADATAMTIDSSENVGIGTASPTVQLASGNRVIHLDSGANQGSEIKLEGANGLLAIGNTAVASYFYNVSNTPVIFGTNNTERMRILSSGGLTFNGDTASANALDDYEEGTWTPSITGPSWSSTPWLNAEGSYTKIGRQVHVEFILFAKITGFPTLNSDGNCSLAGLPFTHENNYTDGRVWINLVPIQALGGIEDGVLNLELFDNNTSGVIRKPNTGGAFQSSLQGSEIISNSRISASFTYTTNV